MQVKYEKRDIPANAECINTNDSASFYCVVFIPYMSIYNVEL